MANFPVIGTITKAGKGSYWRIPSQPEEIKVKIGVHMQKFSLVNLGSVTWQHGTEPQSVSWDGKFWGRERRNLSYLLAPGEWMDPKSAVEHLNNFVKKQEKLLLFISQTDVNFICQISAFDYSFSGGYGDVDYSITFTQYNELKIKQTSTSDSKTGKEETKPRTDSQTVTETKHVRTNGANLRLRSGKWGTIIGSMPNGSEITTDGKTDAGWLHVKYGDTWGWAYSDWMK